MGFFAKWREESSAKSAAKAERDQQARVEAERAAIADAVAAVARARALPKPLPGPGGKDFVEAEYGVPYCEFERTAEGFRVRFNRTSVGVHAAVNTAAGPKNLAQGVGSLIGLGIAGAVALAQKAGAGDTIIEVTRHAVIIDGKNLARKDFKHFSVGKSWKGDHYSKTLAVLSYRYGIRNFEFGGHWEEHEAVEVASALNDHLRDTSMAGEGDRASPNTLRTTRPVDF